MTIKSIFRTSGLVLAIAPLMTGCGGIMADLSSDGELNEEYRLKHLYSECIKDSAKTGVDCTELKRKLLIQQEWNDMDGGV
jgi:hypothetical protein